MQSDINQIVVYHQPSDIFEFSSDEDILKTEVEDFEIISVMWAHEARFDFSVKEFENFLNSKKLEIQRKRIN